MPLGYKIGGGLIVLAALGLLLWLYGGARYDAGKSEGASTERTRWQDEVVRAERAKLAAYQAGVASVQRADGRYIETIREKVVPLTRTIVERTTEYAKTPAGVAVCLSPDRVLWLEQTRGSLFTPAASGSAPGVAGTVRPDAPGPEPRRVDE